MCGDARKVPGREVVVKADNELQHDVFDEIRCDPCTRHAKVEVFAKGGNVTLIGFTTTYSQRWAAEQAALKVAGVRGVTNDLEVRTSYSDRRGDTEIAQAAGHMLQWHVFVPPDHIRVAVANGWVTLGGSVEWRYQKEAAEDAVRYLTGVRGVSNLISVEPTASAEGVSGRIEEALRRNARLETSGVTVEAHGNTVVLRGTVRSFAERQETERVAWSAPGVSRVENHVAISP